MLGTRRKKKKKEERTKRGLLIFSKQILMEFSFIDSFIWTRMAGCQEGWKLCKV